MADTGVGAGAEVAGTGAGIGAEVEVERTRKDSSEGGEGAEEVLVGGGRGLRARRS